MKVPEELIRLTKELTSANVNVGIEVGNIYSTEYEKYKVQLDEALKNWTEYVVKLFQGLKDET
jgi:hypothetical protein